MTGRAGLTLRCCLCFSFSLRWSDCTHPGSRRLVPPSRPLGKKTLPCDEPIFYWMRLSMNVSVHSKRSLLYWVLKTNKGQTVSRHAHINTQLLMRIQPRTATDFHCDATVSFNRALKFWTETMSLKNSLYPFIIQLYFNLHFCSMWMINNV